MAHAKHFSKQPLTRQLHPCTLGSHGFTVLLERSTKKIYTTLFSRHMTEIKTKHGRWRSGKRKSLLLSHSTRRRFDSGLQHHSQHHVPLSTISNTEALLSR